MHIQIIVNDIRQTLTYNIKSVIMIHQFFFKYTIESVYFVRLPVPSKLKYYSFS
jgi:hypothetical protein